ncbi:hypothetical protein RIF29_40824 [Crotalaria pallida]|uniref:FAS1 domain-containing protein n=1 Tax=Crotalaria pallida TaxID=3830 RepID=A0AAN9HQY8_CROPI
MFNLLSIRFFNFPFFFFFSLFPMMGMKCLIMLFLLLGYAESQSSIHLFNHTDLQAAIGDMRAKSYYGFAMLLQMLNGTTQEPTRELTFFMPDDRELSASAISADQLEEFLLRHAIPMPLYFNDLSHFPTGTLVPSGVGSKMMRIHNRGRNDFFVNNAQIVSANVCMSSEIKCHGIDAIIEYDDST